MFCSQAARLRFRRYCLTRFATRRAWGSNGFTSRRMELRFAQNRDFALEAKAAGLHAVYLQFDGISEAKNSHRGIGNYMEVKHRALENIAAAGMRTTLQVSVVNGRNNDGLGDVVRFVIANVDKIHGVIFQPVMFSGRDEAHQRRGAIRLTLSGFADRLRPAGTNPGRLAANARLVSGVGVRNLRPFVRCSSP